MALVQQDDKAKQQKAIELAQVNARQYQNDQQALTTLAWACHRLGREDDSRKLMTRAAKNRNMTADMVYFYSRIAAQSERIEKVKPALQRAIDSDGRFLLRREAEKWMEEIEREQARIAPRKKDPASQPADPAK